MARRKERRDDGGTASGSLHSKAKRVSENCYHRPNGGSRTGTDGGAGDSAHSTGDGLRVHRNDGSNDRGKPNTGVPSATIYREAAARNGPAVFGRRQLSVECGNVFLASLDVSGGTAETLATNVRPSEDSGRKHRHAKVRSAASPGLSKAGKHLRGLRDPGEN